MSLLHFEMTPKELVAEYVESHNEMVDLIDKVGLLTSREEQKMLHLKIQNYMEDNAHLRSHIFVNILEISGYTIAESGRYIPKPKEE